MWKFHITDSWEKIQSEEYQTRWINILNCSPTSHVFFHPALVQIWVESYLHLRKMRPLFIWGHVDGEVEVFFPLILWEKNWKGAFIKSIVPVGYSDYDYHDPLFSRTITDVEKESFWSDLMIFLTHCDADVIEIDGIRDYMISTLAIWQKDEICPCLDLSELNNEEELQFFLKPKLRGDVRRQIRRLTEQGNLELNEYYDHVPYGLFEDFMKAHSRKWPNAYKAPGFHPALINMIHGNSPVHFSTLNLNGKTIAWHLGFKYNNIYYYYMPIGNHEYEKYSPAKIHLYYLLAKFIKRGYTLFDHLRGSETYKDGWSNRQIYVNHIRVYNKKATTKLKLLVLKIKKIIKK